MLPAPFTLLPWHGSPSLVVYVATPLLLSLAGPRRLATVQELHGSGSDYIRRRQDFGVDQISDFLLDLRRDTFFKPRFCALPARKSELLMGVDRKPFGAQVMLSKLTASC